LLTNRFQHRSRPNLPHSAQNLRIFLNFVFCRRRRSEQLGPKNFQNPHFLHCAPGKTGYPSYPL
jgi:hypothetical protein